MRQLMLMRHAKAVPEHTAGDFARPLAPRGIDQVQRVAHAFRAQGWQPELTLASPAARTRQTAEVLEKNLGDINIIIDPVLYLASDDQMLDVLASMPEAITRILLIGHNPGISDLAARLNNQHHLPPLPTAGFMICSLDIDCWSNIRWHQAID